MRELSVSLLSILIVLGIPIIFTWVLSKQDRKQEEVYKRYLRLKKHKNKKK